MTATEALEQMQEHLRAGDVEAATEVARAAGISDAEMQATRMEMATRHELPDSDTRQMFVNGRECFDASDWNGAIAWFEAVLVDPTLEESAARRMHENLGRAYLHAGGTGGLERATEHLRLGGLSDADIEAVRSQCAAQGGIGGEGQTLFEQGRTKYAAGDYAGAAELWGQALDGADAGDEQRRVIYWNIAQARVRQAEWGLALDAATSGGYTEADIRAYWDEVHPS